MWFITVAAIALIIGNVLRRSGIEAARANACGSAAALVGRRKSGIVTFNSAMHEVRQELLSKGCSPELTAKPTRRRWRGSANPR